MLGSFVLHRANNRKSKVTHLFVLGNESLVPLDIFDGLLLDDGS